MLDKDDAFGPSFLRYNSSRPCGTMEGMKIYLKEGKAVFHSKCVATQNLEIFTSLICVIIKLSIH